MAAAAQHVRSPHAAFRAVQEAADALFWTQALGGCETTRDSTAAIASAGFDVVAVERGFHSSSPLTITSARYVVGMARTATARSEAAGS